MSVQMSVQPQQGTYYAASQITVSPTSASGGVGEVLSNTERTLQSWKHSLFVNDCFCCCKREVKRFEMEVSSERLTNVVTQFHKACCSTTSDVSYETVYLPHVVGMAMGRSRMLQSGAGALCSCLNRTEESKPCCCDPNQTDADWLHIYSTSEQLTVRAYLPVSVFPQVRVAVASAKAPTSQQMQ